MRSYILLRNNKESGPFTLQELREFGLSSSDLVWIEGESSSWKHPSEIRELRAMANQGIKKTLPGWINEKVSTSSTGLIQTGTEQFLDDPFTRNTSNQVLADYLDNSNNYSLEGLIPKRRGISISMDLFGLGVLLMGVIFFALFVKKMVDHFDFEPSPSGLALEIKTETLPISLSSHNAKTINTIALRNEVPIGSELKNTDSLQPNRDLNKKLASKLDATAVKPLIATATSENKPEIELKATVNEMSTEKVELLTVKEEEKTEKAPVERCTPSLELSANEYKVGVFGGVSNLEISVSNPSSFGITKAVIEVEFLKPNGNVVKSTTMTVENISPRGLKRISIPDSNRGVKVRFRIISVDILTS